MHFPLSNFIVEFDDEDSMSEFTMCLDISYHKITFITEFPQSLAKQHLQLLERLYKQYFLFKSSEIRR